MVTFPICKVNLGLFVTEKRADGYHSIESIFLPVPISDILEVIPQDENHFDLSFSGLPIEGDIENNTCFKAWDLLRNKHNVSGVKVHLHKKLPSGAGLGGGSSDGAFMLKQLNDLFQLELSQDQLRNYSAEIGSDCPFFITSQTSFVSGRGEIIEPIALNLKGLWIAIVNPSIHVNTASAFKMLSPKKSSFDLREITKMPKQDWKKFVINDFEVVIGRAHPEILRIKSELLDQGAFYASMSGSGSSVFALFDHQPSLLLPGLLGIEAL